MESMDDKITARNTEDGTVGVYRRFLVEHPVLGEFLEEVEPGSKPLVELDDLVVEKFDLPPREETLEDDLEEEDE